MTAINRHGVLPRREKKLDIIYNPIKWALGRTKDSLDIQCDGGQHRTVIEWTRFDRFSA